MQITLSHLSVGYKVGHAVVSDINLTLQSGKLASLIGANGVGKSTLLKTLTGFLPKLEGSLLLDGKDISEFSQRALARQISIVLTQKPEVQNLTVEEIVGLGRSPYTGFFGKLHANDQQIVDESITAVGIEKLKNRMIQTLSDGERQKVMIAKALAQQTPVIFLDEPTAFLDFSSKVETFQLLQRMAHEMGKLVLLSTHDLELAVRFSDTLLQVNGDGLRTVSNEEVTHQMQMIINKQNK
ncbi:MAG: ABC transporter ATP-binding protein [Prevotella histicola]|jgi:ferrichrome ABC transporter, ATP-binding protein FhuC|uniref:ABC transporter ATP-binding protein n=1 Tax=Prevotella histicola JCM 15637 = DNF00424 TaxID=1236504 RepID=A0AAW3FFE3_9BACT|nr:ABC transporter ATP-binding protein [Prevotella histicola]KGF25889.1 ABC transporter ATP-binding protein [Prevotella histicola JCM 15637 = DNF00424]MBF1410309.1 ABC transporter ATP-binding protein [Prevotella histicola]MBF1416529.1 ABC transporter ATP-binding protein [Prevotella histicola]MBF1423157.1 ABC transporter ATP-binding protein [Prevotella histicola]MBS6662364.1 ABC transporter ATP-binding protein [Prevotella histicola]